MSLLRDEVSGKGMAKPASWIRTPKGWGEGRFYGLVWWRSLGPMRMGMSVVLDILPNRKTEKKQDDKTIIFLRNLTQAPSHGFPYSKENKGARKTSRFSRAEEKRARAIWVK